MKGNSNLICILAGCVSAADILHVGMCKSDDSNFDLKRKRRSCRRKEMGRKDKVREERARKKRVEKSNRT